MNLTAYSFPKSAKYVTNDFGTYYDFNRRGVALSTDQVIKNGEIKATFEFEPDSVIVIGHKTSYGWFKVFMEIRP